MGKFFLTTRDTVGATISCLEFTYLAKLRSRHSGIGDNFFSHPIPVSLLSACRPSVNAFVFWSSLLASLALIYATHSVFIREKILEMPKHRLSANAPQECRVSPGGNQIVAGPLWQIPFLCVTCSLVRCRQSVPNRKLCCNQSQLVGRSTDERQKSSQWLTGPY